MTISNTFKSLTSKLLTNKSINMYTAVRDKDIMLNLEIPFVIYLWNNNLVVQRIADKLYVTIAFVQLLMTH